MSDFLKKFRVTGTAPVHPVSTPDPRVGTTGTAKIHPLPSNGGRKRKRSQRRSHKRSHRRSHRRSHHRRH